MSEQRVLVLGANGQLGRALPFVFPNATYFGRAECDFLSEEAITALPLSEFDVVINAAAYTAVDAAETSEGSLAAYAINTRAVQLLAELAAKTKTVLVHVSTDYVFDGTKTTPYSEIDSFNPLGIYAKSKARGDEAVSSHSNHYILRTSWVIGEGNNFVRTMASLAQRGIDPSVVNDQVGRLTFTQDLALGIRHLLSKNAPFGTYNLSNEGPASSWSDIAKRVYELTGNDPERITGVSTEQYFSGKEGIAPRPLWSMLDLSKIEATGFIPPSWETRLEEYLS